MSVRGSRLFVLCAMFLAWSHYASADPLWSWDTVPANGAVAGAPGDTTGWGYSITNQSATDWLMITNASLLGLFSPTETDTADVFRVRFEELWLNEGPMLCRLIEGTAAGASLPFAVECVGGALL